MWPRPFRDHDIIPILKLEAEPEHSVILLGAGASVHAGGPLIRHFVNRARDLVKLGRCTTSETDDLRALLETHDSLREHLRLTEEDLDNIENLLSFTYLAGLTKGTLVDKVLPPQAAGPIRRSIDTILAQSIQAPSPASPKWAGDVGDPFMKCLVSAITYLGDRVTIITLNYDCLLEYACHCMGLPFTYSRAYGDGVEILKLHGSINWVVCEDSTCDVHNNPMISGVTASGNADQTSLRRTIVKCPQCEGPVTPLIVPPTSAKEFNYPVFRDVWSRAITSLAASEVFVAMGYSLPLTDFRVRELLHMGFASGRLRSAMAVVGLDEHAADRWSRLFRPAWAQNHLAVQKTTFENVVQRLLLQALVIPETRGPTLLPLSKSPSSGPSQNDRFVRLVGEDSEVADLLGRYGWAQGQMDGRQKKWEHSLMAGQVFLRDNGFAWEASGEVLPTHGTCFPRA